MTALLEVRDLAVRYPGGVDALRGISFTLPAGGSLAVVGESGSGKSTLARCLAGLLQPPEASGSVRLDGVELLGAPEPVLQKLRWTTVAVSVQGTPFNPVTTVGAQIAEPLQVHRRWSRADAHRRAGELAAEIGLDAQLLDAYPHELSGGEQRRAALAMALVCDPALLVLDEPTAGLDPAGKQELLAALEALARRRQVGLLVVSHDLSDAARLAAATMVLYGGQVMESGATRAVLGEPAHPYSWGLVNAFPVMSTTKDLRPIRGQSPDPRALPPGCPYQPRCTQAEAICEQPIVLEPSRGRLVACHLGGRRTLLAAVDVDKSYRRAGRQVEALREAFLEVGEGEAVGLVGPSGSGKTTLARILAGHLLPDRGEVLLDGQPLPRSSRRAERLARRRVQLVMQNPWDAVSPRLPVAAILREALELAGRERTDGGDGDDEAVRDALHSVGLPATPAFLAAHSHELSGGQLQRIVLARALLAQPKLLVADEPTSMLDASEQARLLVTLRERQVELGLGLVLVSHDLALVRKVTDRIVVLDAGRVVETGLSHLVSSRPNSATARDLIAAAPSLSALDRHAGPPAGAEHPERDDELATERR